MPDRRELIARLVPESNQPLDLTLINGFVGRSDQDGFIRLYLDVMATRWQEVPIAQIVHQTALDPSPDNPWGEDLIWMLRDDAMALPVHGAGDQEPAGGEGGIRGAGENGGGGGFGDGGRGRYHKMWPPR